MRTETHSDPKIEARGEDSAERETLFIATFNQAAVGISHVTEKGHWIRVNEKLCEIVGYSREELLQTNFQEITHPDDLPKNLDLLNSLLRGEILTYTMEKRYIRKDGRVAWAELTVSMVRTPGLPAYLIAVIVDIDARKKVEAELKAAHLQLAREREIITLERDNFFNISRDVMAITEGEGIFVRVNPALCDLIGRKSEDIVGRSIYEFVFPDDIPRTRAYRESLVSGQIKESDHLENRLVNKDGSVRWISWKGRSVHGERNYISGRDITDRKAAENAAKERQARMTTNLKLNAIGLMAANMAHEINNPLTIIYGEACILRKMVDQGDSTTSKLKRIADNVVKMSERIVSIVNGLRSLSRDGASDPMRTIPLRQIFEETIPFCRAKITADQIELIAEELPDNIFVCCRSVQLSQALLNLLNNAYDAVIDLTSAGKIEVFTRLTESRIEIFVSDNGPGVPEDIRKDLFQPFTSSKGIGKGLGLGLSVSKEMIEANGGNLFLKEDCAQTTFVISLPRVTS